VAVYYRVTILAGRQALDVIKANGLDQPRQLEDILCENLENIFYFIKFIKYFF
jgi:hypothetical protein